MVNIAVEYIVPIYGMETPLSLENEHLMNCFDEQKLVDYERPKMFG